jgi:sulfite reductase (NADPH) flavoprotein alpha-component
LENMGDHPEGYDLSSEQVLLAACSTQGDGVPPSEAREFCEWLSAGRAGALPALAYSVLALGDRSYAHFCRCGKSVDAALAAAGAAPLAPRVDVDKEDWAAVDGWVDAVIAALPSLQGLKSIAQLGGGEEKCLLCLLLFWVFVLFARLGPILK